MPCASARPQSVTDAARGTPATVWDRSGPFRAAFGPFARFGLGFGRVTPSVLQTRRPTSTRRRDRTRDLRKPPLGEHKSKSLGPEPEPMPRLRTLRICEVLLVACCLLLACLIVGERGVVLIPESGVVTQHTSDTSEAETKQKQRNKIEIWHLRQSQESWRLASVRIYRKSAVWIIKFPVSGGSKDPPNKSIRQQKWIAIPNQLMVYQY